MACPVSVLCVREFVRRRVVAAVGLCMSVALSGCASYAPDRSVIGLSREEVVARLGDPYPAPSGVRANRLDFPRGPYGKHTYFVHFDEQGRATRVEQVLSEERFDQIAPGMSTDEVIQRIGISRSTFGLARERGFVWSYRYENPLCRWFQIEFTKEGTVRSAGYSKPPECRGARALVFGF